MNIQKIYNRYRIPSNLQQHMRWVAQVADEVVVNWTGPVVDAELIHNTALLHDMANLIKFKRPFLGEMKNKLFWEQIQDEFIAQYGPDVHKATLVIIDELGMSDTVGKVLLDMELKVTDKITKASWEARIVEYADCRVGLKGVTTLEKRIDDLKFRYNLKDDDSGIKAWRLNADQVRQYYQE